ncbi:hypothetical protein RSAG8_11028, partial [Rhizoctonia solani AG-8 WAC10335]
RPPPIDLLHHFYVHLAFRISIIAGLATPNVSSFVVSLAHTQFLTLPRQPGDQTTHQDSTWDDQRATLLNSVLHPERDIFPVLSARRFHPLIPQSQRLAIPLPRKPQLAQCGHFFP